MQIQNQSVLTIRGTPADVIELSGEHQREKAHRQCVPTYRPTFYIL